MKRCKCTHVLSGHRKDRRGKWLCESVACGCAEPRPSGAQPIAMVWPREFSRSPEKASESQAVAKLCNNLSISDSGARWTPARFREEYAPDGGIVRRYDFGARQVDEYPEHVGDVS